MQLSVRGKNFKKDQSRELKNAIITTKEWTCMHALDQIVRTLAYAC